MSGEPATVDLQAFDLGGGNGLGSQQESGQLLQVVLAGSAKGCEGAFGINDVGGEFGTDPTWISSVVKSRLSN
jgi:hypothetical protein